MGELRWGEVRWVDEVGWGEVSYYTLVDSCNLQSSSHNSHLDRTSHPHKHLNKN